MIRWMLLSSMVLFFFSGQSVFARDKDDIPGSGNHFIANVAPASSILTIRTTTPNWTYPKAGIKILTPGYSIVGETPSSNGFVLFSVSDTAPAHFTLSGPVGVINIRLCLNGVGKTYSCEDYALSVFTSHVIFVTSSQYDGNLKGAADNGAHGADAICQNVASTSGNPLLTGLIFKALLVTPTRNPCSSDDGGVSGQCGGSFANDWPLVVGSQYVYADGTTLFNTVNQNGVFDGSNAFLNDENNTPMNNASFWSGIQSILSNDTATDIAGWAYDDMNSTVDGVRYANNLHSCQGFTSNNPIYMGANGALGIPPIPTGAIDALTWGNYTGFSNSLSAFKLLNIFSQSSAIFCSIPLNLICVS